MAEKNTESTAVNQLIELVATAQPLPPDPTEDLMFRSERPERRPKTPTPKPLPRGRAPIGTQQGLQTIQPPNSPVNQTIRSMPPGVRITTAPVSRSITIPPVASNPVSSAPLTLDDYKDDDAEVTNPGPETFARPTSQGFPSARPSATGSNAAPLAAEPPASRITKPTLPPPLPTMRASSPPPFRPSTQATRDFSYPVVPNLPALPPPGTPSMPHPKQMPVVTFDTEHTDIDDSLASILEPKVDLDDRMSSSWMENEIGTQQVPKRNDWKVIAGKLIGPMVVLVIAGIFIGGYFAFDGDGGKKRKPKTTEGQTITMPMTSAANAAATTEAKTEDVKVVATEAKTEAAPEVKTEAAPEVKADVKAEPAAVTPPNLAKAEPAPPPVTPPNLASSTAPAKTEPAPAKTEPAPVAPVAPSTGRPTLVDVRIDSNPTGATVTLIDRGKSTFLGTTPMSAAVDAARKYELVFSYENRATVVEALDPSTTKKVSVRLSRAKSGSSSSSTTAMPVAKVEAPKPAAPKTDKTEASKLAVPNFDKTEAPKPAKIEKTEAPKAEKAAATPAAGGEGTLMISSKPPCEIHVDGKPTGLTTPQRAITLPAGAHKITLVNGAEGIKKTVSVQITADKPTKVIQDFMK